MGGNRFRVDMPRLLDLWRQGRLKLDHLISGHIKLEGINEGFAMLKFGTPVRNLINFGVHGTPSIHSSPADTFGDTVLGQRDRG